MRHYWVDPLELTDKETHNEPYCGPNEEAAIVVMASDYERTRVALEKLFARVCFSAPDLITADNHEYGDMVRAVIDPAKAFPGAKPPPCSPASGETNADT
jgi:hypothetical protein